MATLSDAELQVDILTGDMAKVTTSVKIVVDPTDWLSPIFGFPFIELKATIMGEDGYWDDTLLQFSNQRVTESGVYTFTTNVPIVRLNEDWGEDEIYTKFNVVNYSNPRGGRTGPEEMQSNFITGEFGWPRYM